MTCEGAIGNFEGELNYLATMTRIILHIVILLTGVILPSFFILLGGGRLDPYTSVALCAGASAFSLMAINLFLATRPWGIEALLGGLDRLYVTHKWIGISVLVLALVHEQVGMRFEDDEKATVGLAALAKEVGEIAITVLIILVLVSWIKRLPSKITAKIPFLKPNRDLVPYAFWRWTHRIMGVLFAVLAFHQFFVAVPYEANSFSDSYLNMMAALGLVSFIYSQTQDFTLRRKYTVSSVERLPAATVITAQPTGRPTRTRPGSFAMIAAGKAGLREPHPFTVSGATEDGAMQFSIKPLGDYTTKLRDSIAKGDTLFVRGVYGTFSYIRGPKTQLWVAGGIGITPFLSFADSLTEQTTQEIVLVYCVTTRDELIGVDRLEAAAKRCPNFKYVIHCSADEGRISGSALVKYAGFDLTKAGLWFCGPAPMRKALLAQLKEEKQSPKSVHFEVFEFR